MCTATEGDLAYRILQLERSLAAYRRLHSEELDELERCLTELKTEVLALHRVQQIEAEKEAEYDMNATTEEFANRGEAM